MSTVNHSAWLDAKGTPLRVGESAMPTPSETSLIVKNHAIAINPVEHMQQASGFLIKEFPYVLGSDVAGTVTTVGSGITNFKPGDRVVGHAWAFLTNKNQDAAYSEYVNLEAKVTAKIPDSVSFAQAATIPLAMDTASAGLQTILGLPFPSLDAKPIGKTVVVYGASSSVGSMAVQLSAGAGADVVAITSAKNAHLAKKVGAKEVFDYRDPDVVAKVVEAVEKTGGEFVGIYDAISEDSTRAINFAILDKFGGGKFATTHLVPEDVPKNIEAKFVFGAGDFSVPIWQQWVTPALEKGQLVAIPEPFVFGKGLESLQGAVDKLKAGVSGQKIVVEL